MAIQANGGGDGQPGSPPPVKKVKLEYASSTAASTSSTMGDTLKVGHKCNFALLNVAPAAAADKKIENDRVESAGSSLLAAALLLKRENSAEEAKFDIHANGKSTTEATAMLSPATKELLMNTKAEEMKAEIAQIDSILRNRLLKEAATSANSCDFKKEGEAEILPKVRFFFFKFFVTDF
jgi:hypothetical protein